jgi:hypothetical protein
METGPAAPALPEPTSSPAERALVPLSPLSDESSGRNPCSGRCASMTCGRRARRCSSGQMFHSSLSRSCTGTETRSLLRPPRVIWRWTSFGRALNRLWLEGIPDPRSAAPSGCGLPLCLPRVPHTVGKAKGVGATERIPQQLRPLYPVGETGFEPATPWSRTKCSTRLSHSPGAAHGWPLALRRRPSGGTS